MGQGGDHQIGRTINKGEYLIKVPNATSGRWTGYVEPLDRSHSWAVATTTFLAVALGLSPNRSGHRTRKLAGMHQGARNPSLWGWQIYCGLELDAPPCSPESLPPCSPLSDLAQEPPEPITLGRHKGRGHYSPYRLPVNPNGSHAYARFDKIVGKLSSVLFDKSW